MSISGDISLYAPRMEKRTPFGDWFEAHYLSLNLTQQQIADYVGVGQSTVSGWIRAGKKPRTRIRARLAEILKIELSELQSRIEHGSAKRTATAPESVRFDRVLSMAARNQDKLSPATKAAMTAAIMVDLASEDWDEAEFDEE